MNKYLLSYSKYLLLIAHPDDEINCAALISRILKSKKQLKIILITKGDAGFNNDVRQKEMFISLKTLGIKKTNFHELGVSEGKLFKSFPNIFEKVSEIIATFKPDCVLTTDFDGGHEGHDSANYIAHQAIKNSNTEHIVYPDYHFRNMKRYGLAFLPGRRNNFKLDLTEDEKNLKIKLIEAHAGQINFFLRMQKIQNNYFKLLFEREIFRIFPENFNYFTRPKYQIGYEYHRNGFKFEDFLIAAKSISNA